MYALKEVNLSQVDGKPDFTHGMLYTHKRVCTSLITFAECGRLCFSRCVFIYLYALYSPINSKNIQPNRMTFGEMIGYYPHH